VFVVCGHIPVMGLSNNCGSLRVMSALPYLDYLLHLSVEMMMKCERGYKGCTLYREYKLL
jgi:hypothetical protein